MSVSEACIGKWILDSSYDENVDAYFKAIGINKPLRIIAKKLKVSYVFSVDNETWTIKNINSLKTTEITFKMGEWASTVTADNKTTQNVFNIEGNKLVSTTKGYCADDIHAQKEFFGDYLIETVRVKDVSAKRRYNQEK